MMIENIVCTGCSLLCNDVDVEVQASSIKRTRGACSHGDARLKGFQQNRLRRPLINGTPTDIDRAIEAIAERLKSAKAPLIYGGECSSNRTIELALKLAEKLEAYYDAPSSICRVVIPIQEELEIKSFSLDEVLDEADFIIYWGVSVADTHLRHASRYAVMPRGSVVKMGRESRIVATIDARESMTMKISQHKILIDPCFDTKIAKAIADLVDGYSPSLDDVTARQIAILVSDLKRASFIALFLGSNILRCNYCGETVRGILELVKRLSARYKCSVHPMAENVNSYGQAKIMWKILKTCFPYSFKEKKSVEPIHILVARQAIDFVLAINSDVLTQIPLKISRSLRMKLACTTELRSITQENSVIAMPIKILGVEAGGVVTRTDGVDVDLKPFITNDELPSEEEVLSRLLASI
ncbi:MAG: hypothetical protein QXP29_07260 [Candidatus Nezhaarchaeales archaeon]